MLRILNSFSSCDDVDVLLQCDSVVQHYVFFSPPDGIQRVSVRLTGVPSLGGVCAFADGPFSAFVSPGSTSFVVQKVRAWLYDCCSSLSRIQGLRWRHGCSGRTLVGIAVKTSLFGRIFAKFEDLGVVQVGGQILRFFAELVDHLRLAQVLKEWFLVLVVLELFDQLLDLVLTCCVLLLDCRTRYWRYSVIHGVVTGFTVTFRIAGWFPGWSCVLALWILLTILRVRFQLDTWHSRS